MKEPVGRVGDLSNDDENKKAFAEGEEGGRVVRLDDNRDEA